MGAYKIISGASVCSAATMEADKGDPSVPPVFKFGRRDTLEIVYRWPDGREEVRYRRHAGSREAFELMAEVRRLEDQNTASPYSYRFA